MKVAIIGSGYVGLVTAAGLADLGHEVVCVDLNRERVEQINRRQPPFHEPGLPELLERHVGRRLRATTSLVEALADAELSFIAVHTPPQGEAIDLRHVAAAAADIGRALRDRDGYHVVAVKSTVVPGTTGGLVRRELENASGKKLGAYGLCMNPEFLREGSAVADFQHPDRVIIGAADRASGRVMDALYAGFNCPKIHVPLRSAELIKYTSNCLLAMLVSFSNEIAALCEATPEADSEAVMDGVALDRRLSPLVGGTRITPGILSYLRAGIGFGGSCLPKDVNALRMFARSLDVQTPLLDAVVAVNDERPRQVIQLLERHLGTLRDKVVVVLGLAFKPGTDDLRDSPSLRLIQVLLERQTQVRAHDPLCTSKARSVVDERVLLVDDPARCLTGADAVVVGTAWPEFAGWDWDRLAASMRFPLILDARNCLRAVRWPPGIRYLTIGKSYQPAVDRPSNSP